MDDQSAFEKAKQQKNIDNVNNANNIKAAANVAQHSGNPYAAAIGKGINVADKLSGGKASEKLGKALTTANKMAGLKGKIAQKALNKSSESGTSNRIGQALSAKKGAGALASQNTKAPLSNAGTKGKLNTESSGNQTEMSKESLESGSGEAKIFQVPKLVKYGVIAMGPISLLIVFIALLTTSSNVVIKSVGLGNADSLSDEDVEEKINKKTQDEKAMDEGVTDEDLGLIYDEYSLSFADSKLRESNLVTTAVTTYLKRKYNAASLDKLEDFYPPITNLSKNYDKNMVYDFFFKMYNLYTSYRDKYGVNLDLPLLMATLNMQSDDMNEIFSANLSKEDREKTKRSDYSNMDYYYDWSSTSFESTKTKSEHDMEILAQHMVVEKESSECKNPVNGKCYVVDVENYKEFLKEFIEKKYYTKEGFSVTTSPVPSTSGSCRTSTTSFHKFNLTEDQLAKIASLCVHEQGSPEGAAAEASLIANKFDLNNGGKEVADSGTKLFNYVRNSGWWAHAAANMDDKSASTEALNAVRDVLVNGYRTLPAYIDEHDYRGDISSVTTNGVSKSINDNSSYEQHKTIIKNKMGSTYTFYTFPTPSSDPFGYTSTTNRKNLGETYFEYGSKECTGDYVPTSNGSWRNWRQCGKSWSNITVPKSSKSMCQIGCLITSITIQIARSGTATVVENIDPGVAVKKYSFVSGGNFIWDSARNLAPNFRYSTQISLAGMSKQAVAKKLSSYDPKKYYIVLGVGRYERNTLHHYVAFEYADQATGELYMINPSSDDNKVYSLYRVYDAHIYEKRD